MATKHRDYFGVQGHRGCRVLSFLTTFVDFQFLAKLTESTVNKKLQSLERPGTIRLLRVDVQLVVSLVLTLMRMLQRVLMLVLMRMLMLQRRVSSVESHTSGQRTSSTVGANNTRCVRQFVVLRPQATKPNESILGDEHRRACGRCLLVDSAATSLLHRRVPAATFRVP